MSTAVVPSHTASRPEGTDAIAQYHLRYHRPASDGYKSCIEKGNALRQALVAERNARRDLISSQPRLDRLCSSLPDATAAEERWNLYDLAKIERDYINARVARAQAEIDFFQLQSFPDVNDIDKFANYFLEALERAQSQMMPASRSSPQIKHEAWKAAAN
ncbi:hypothetical protein H0H92_014841 [Tricholoma furcatifolium]|nr:hypothetical protein H0H92_014841 [Tricholoma furcatifolium]